MSEHLRQVPVVTLAAAKAMAAAAEADSFFSPVSMTPRRPARILSLGAVLLEGGLPVRMGGQVVGAIGVSGMTSSQDGEVADAGLQALQV